MNSVSGWNWEPVSRARFEDILSKEAGTLPDDALRTYAACAIGIVEHPCYRSEQYGIERVFVVARSGTQMLFFDDVEDEFAAGVPDADGVLRQWHLYDALVVALRNLLPASSM